ADRGLAGVARRVGEARIEMQAGVVEIFRRLFVQLHRLIVRLADADELQEPRAVRVRMLALARDLAPETLHRRLARLVAEVREIAVDVVHLRAPLPSLDRAAA